MKYKMKNILVLNYEFPPLGWWASPVSYELSKWYVDLWYTVDVITMWYKNLPEFENVDWINVYRVKCLRTKKQVCHPWEQATYLYSWYKKAKELLKTKKYDICHAHFIIPTWVIALKLKKEFNIPYIITAHGSDVIWYNPRFSFLYKFLKKPWNNILENSKKIISPSKYLKEKIENINPKIKEKLEVIPNWIEKDKFKPLKKEKYILTVSRLQKSKWIQDLIEAVKNIELWEWKIKIVWDWPYKGTLEKMVKNYKLEDKVKFLSWIDNKSEEMEELYGKASIFCQPSFFENASIVLLEAMQSWCAIIARNAWWNPETISKKQLFEDIIDLEQKLNYLINNEEMLYSISNENVEKIERYDWKNITLKYNKNL